MRQFSVREMRAGYGAIATALETDGEVVLTHHGKPFAKVVPLTEGVAEDDATRQRERARGWAARQRRFLAGQPELPPFDWDELRADR